MPIVLDTHAWIWWVTNDSRLSKRARARIATAADQDDLALSMISIWELSKKVEKGQLVLDRDLDSWLDLATTGKPLHLIELTRPILIDSCRLPKPFHGDPADQIIVATTRSQAGLVITKDKKIRAYAHVQSFW